MCLERDTFRTHSSCLGKMELSECELGYSPVAYSPDRSKSLKEQLNSPIATCFSVAHEKNEISVMEQSFPFAGYSPFLAAFFR